MKQLTVLTLAITFFFLSCKKSSTSPTPATDTSIQNIVTQTMIDSITAAGGTIYSGSNPPIVNGIYLMHPDSCIFDNSPGNTAGKFYDDYKFQFSNQNNSESSITVLQKDESTGALNPAPVSTYITGNGNSFSIYILSVLTPEGIKVQKFNIFSGVLTSAGIQGFQNCLYMRAKTGDPDNTVVPAGTIRVFNTGYPGLATLSGSF